jgi:polar amino acid transport system substrate-binding protein
MKPTVQRTLVTLAVLSACGTPFPRDPEHTSDRVRSTRELRVGLTENPPWVVRSPDGQPTGLEVEVARRLAARQGALVRWHWGQLEALFTQLEEHQLDLVIGGIDAETPWEGRVGLTEPWNRAHASDIVLAVPPGENGWMGEVERVAVPYGREIVGTR